MAANKSVLFAAIGILLMTGYIYGVPVLEDPVGAIRNQMISDAMGLISDAYGVALEQIHHGLAFVDAVTVGTQILGDVVCKILSLTQAEFDMCTAHFYQLLKTTTSSIQQFFNTMVEEIHRNIDLLSNPASDREELSGRLYEQINNLVIYLEIAIEPIASCGGSFVESSTHIFSGFRRFLLGLIETSNYVSCKIVNKEEANEAVRTLADSLRPRLFDLAAKLKLEDCDYEPCVSLNAAVTSFIANNEC